MMTDWFIYCLHRRNSARLGPLNYLLDVIFTPSAALWIFSATPSAEFTTILMISPDALTTMTPRNRGISRSGNSRTNSSRRPRVAMDWTVMDGYALRISVRTRGLIVEWEARRVATLLASGSNGSAINHYWLLKNMITTLVEEMEAGRHVSTNIVRNINASLKEATDHSNTLSANMTWDIFSLGGTFEPAAENNKDDEAPEAPKPRSSQKKPKVRKDKGSTPATLTTDVVKKSSPDPVCLDGSPPAYNLHQGFGLGANSWLINMEGGGWCNNITSCLRHAHSHLGSSLYMGEKLVFSGILTDNQSLNPDFYNWNRVAVRYCDGSSFTGDVEEVTKLRFIVQRIWQVVMEDLLAKCMDKAEHALLTGFSAGGLTMFLHCDEFWDLLLETAKVKCMPDAGFFIDERSQCKFICFSNPRPSSSAMPAVKEER